MEHLLCLICYIDTNFLSRTFSLKSQWNLKAKKQPIYRLVHVQNQNPSVFSWFSELEANLRRHVYVLHLLLTSGKEATCLCHSTDLVWTRKNALLASSLVLYMMQAFFCVSKLAFSSEWGTKGNLSVSRGNLVRPACFVSFN